ncbi:verrucotoxin subunit beta-like [Trematomus bernacchii]|uniref:verrucotoxin subunit beta-like n=1 Tax=Trematomus bernacchii TaxID=40690 RepID=UPI00146C70ED|nr:verrucotoxin subunit beta-like [Trematomus bernacchii]XP_033982730.1 verrucotoxin subunit beta-like [Trematomus bernacchii]
MDSAVNKKIEVAAHGRRFSLGMLYDCRKDVLVPDVKLWDCDDLEKYTREVPEREMVASESIEDKSSALNVEASLKASFLSGLVEVEGSAKYLNDSKTSKNHARVTLTYQATTNVHELSMDHLGRGNVKHPYDFKKAIATHVVTRILYGAQAFFVFDRDVSVNENYEDIESNLKVMINKIPSLAKEGKGLLKMEDKERANVDKCSCKFHRDFALETNPLSFQDAVKVYQSLPKLLEGGENAVPVKVWLLPLTCLDSTGSKLVRQISKGLDKKCQSVLEGFSDLEMRCNDALRTQTAQQFQQIGKKLETFKQKCFEFKQEFQQNLANKLPSIQGGGEEEAVLAEIRRKTCSSPFNSKDLNEWMDCKEREISTLKSYTNMMKNTKIVARENDLHEEILNAKQAVCFVFTSLGSDEPYLSTLSNYLQQTPKTDDAQDPHTPDVEKGQWYLTNKVAETLRNKTKLFSDFAEANKDNKNITFLTVGLTNETQKGASIYLYTDGISVNENFEPPSKPAIVTGSDINHNSVTLKISPPKCGAEDITSYSVEYCVSGEDGWKQKTASKAEEVTVSDLSPNTEYMFRCRAETPVGAGPANEVSGPIKTLPCSPPGKPNVESTSREILVSWEKPAELGQDVHVLSYIVEYAKQDQQVKEEDLHWEQMMAGAEKASISEIQPETEYAVRVRCDCGAAGTSKESITVNVGTTKREFARLAESLKSKSKSIKSKSLSVYKLPLTEEDMHVKGCQMYNFGRESMKQNCKIMLLGATGSGKSTLINGLINYIVGVEWKDDFRFKLVVEDQSRSQTESQTPEVTVYKINHQEGFKIPFSLTVVDTPGFGDTRGIKRDEDITEKIRGLLTSANGVGEIDAVCFVTQASLARLTATQRYVFESVLSIFGKDVAENIQMLVTFADGKQPPVLEAIKKSGVPCPKHLGLPVHFKFNNSALFADNRSSRERVSDENSDEDDVKFDEMFWNMGIKNMEKFFTALTKLTTKTQEVLKD